MSRELKHYTIWMILSFVIFGGTYYLSYIQIPGTSSRALFNALMFALVLYLWSLYSIYKQTKFCKFFLRFTIFTYSVGLLSILITTVNTKFNLLIVAIAVIGLMLNGYIFYKSRLIKKGQTL